MPLGERRVAILIADKFQDEEGTEPRDFLKRHGVQAEYVGLKKGELRGKNGRKTVTVDRTIDEVSPADYDALVIPGGSAPERLRIDERVLRFVQLFWESGRPVAAICHGPQVLISAGLLNGRRATCYVGIRDDVKLAGAEYVDEPVVRDGQLITSRVPADLPQFNQALLEALKELDERSSELTLPENPLEALRVAISREKGAHDFYLELSGRFAEERLRNKFRYLASIEKGHWEDLSALFRSISGGKEPELLERETEISADLDLGNAEPSAITRVAMEAEQKAYEYYKRAAEKARSPRVKEMFSLLAAEELEHKRLLGVDYAAETGGRTFQMATFFDVPPGMEDLW